MNATKNELQHNTMLHYYIGTTVNGAKGIAHTVKANPLWIVAMLVMAWLAYSVQDMRATESIGSNRIGRCMLPHRQCDRGKTDVPRSFTRRHCQFGR